MRSALPILPLLLGFGGVASVLLLGRHPIPLRIVVWLFQFAILAIVVLVLARTWDGTILVHRAGGWQPPVGIAFVADRFSSVFGVTIATVSTAAVAYALLDAEAVPRQRVMALFFMIQAGMYGAVFTGDLFNLYVFVELFGVSSYGLVAYRGQAPHVEAALKYATLSLLASVLMLMGIGSVYAQTGTLTLAALHQASVGLASPPLYLFSIALVLVALTLKAALFPLHFWLPDAHSIAPTAVSIVLSGAVVKVGGYGVLRVLFSHDPWLGGQVGWVLLPLAAVTAVGAAWMAFGQSDLKRFLAYSTASQMGYVLAGGSLGTVAGIRAAVVYSVIHATTKASLFAVAGVAEGIYGDRRWDRMGGLAARSPLLTATALVALLSLAGIPPLAGFSGKLAVFAALAAEGAWLSLFALVIASLTILTAAGRIWLGMAGGAPKGARPRASRSKLAVAAALVFLVVLLGLGTGPLLDAGEAAAVQLLDGRAYRKAVLGP